MLDLLDEEPPQPSRAWAIMCYVDPHEAVVEHWILHCFEVFMSSLKRTKLEDLIIRKIQSGDSIFSYFADFKKANHAYLLRTFHEKHGKNYGTNRLLKIVNVGTLEAMKTQISKLSRGNKVDYYIQEVGKWIPYKPAEELCEDQVRTNE